MAENETDLTRELGAIAAGLTEAKTEIERQDLWRRARHVLAEAGADTAQVDRAMGRRSVLALTRFIADLETRGFDATHGEAMGATGPDATLPLRKQGGNAPGSAAASASAARANPEAVPADGPSPEDLRKAIRAFKKRLKLTILNEESKLGRSPMTSGKKANVVAIMPPYGYRPEIWETLVAQGKLRHTGRGFYELADGGSD